MSAAEMIIQVCERVFDANKDDCNKFVKAVATEFGETFTGNANQITESLSSTAFKARGWSVLADGKAAAQRAQEGHLVVGGLKGSAQATPSAHGHVVIVVKGPLNRAKYPTAYWGRLGGSGSKNKTINWAWRSGDRDKVTYAAKSITHFV